jgi:hypothetical protein
MIRRSSFAAPEHQQSLVFGLKAFLAPKSTTLPAPTSPVYPRVEPGLVAILVLFPPVGIFLWWRRYRQGR